MEVIDLPWTEVLRFLVENPEAQVAGRVQRWDDDEGNEWTGLNPAGEWGLRFTVVPALQGNNLWVPAGTEKQVHNKSVLREQ